MEAAQVSLMDEWINKLWNMHIMESYSALKKKEILRGGAKMAEE